MGVDTRGNNHLKQPVIVRDPGVNLLSKLGIETEEGDLLELTAGLTPFG